MKFEAFRSNAGTKTDNWWRTVRVFVLSSVLSGCATTQVETLDLTQLKPGEGIFVTRIITSTISSTDDGNEITTTPDETSEARYHVQYGTSSRVMSIFQEFVAPKGTYEVDARKGPFLVVSAQPAGDYYFNYLEGEAFGLRFAAKFHVTAKQITYVGDLNVKFTRSKMPLRKDYYHPHSVEVLADLNATTAALDIRFPHTLSRLKTDLMTLESF